MAGFLSWWFSSFEDASTQPQAWGICSLVTDPLVIVLGIVSYDIYVMP